MVVATPLSGATGVPLLIATVTLMGDGDHDRYSRG